MKPTASANGRQRSRDRAGTLFRLTHRVSARCDPAKVNIVCPSIVYKCLTKYVHWRILRSHY